MSSHSDPSDLIPARMLNEHVYCPRLAYLEWAQGEWDDSSDTIEGRFVHRRVDAPSARDLTEDPAGEERPLTARSLLVSSDRLGAIAKIDLVEAEGSNVTPVDYKRGKVPQTESGAYDPERVQLCLAGLLLRENGYSCDHGILYFADSKTRVVVPFDQTLIDLTLKALDELRANVRSATLPPPLVDSPKCPRCSLVGICLPDEVNQLRGESARPARRLRPARDDRLPLYVQEHGAWIGKRGDCLMVSRDGEALATIRLMEVSHVSVFGNTQISTQALRELCDRGIPVCYLSFGNWFYGITTGNTHKNVEARIAQYRAADSSMALRIARRIVIGKIRNQRTLLRRNLHAADEPVLKVLSLRHREAARAISTESLLGIEGLAARVYFGALPRLFRGAGHWVAAQFDANGRNRRPPADEVNATLSFLYALLLRETTVASLAVGLDPYRGIYHAPRYGKPALALDLCEEFRPLIADSVCITAFNQGELGPRDFVRRARGVALTGSGRKRLIAAYERRMNHVVTHPLFGYRISYRRTMEVQARLLRATLLGEVPEYVAFGTR